MVSGRLDQRSWEDKEGQKRSRVEIVVEDFNFIGGTAGSDGGSKSTSSAASTDVAPDDISDEPIDLSEIPF
jgi:single-strand DNA-binding protein